MFLHMPKGDRHLRMISMEKFGECFHSYDSVHGFFENISCCSIPYQIDKFVCDTCIYVHMHVQVCVPTPMEARGQQHVLY